MSKENKIESGTLSKKDIFMNRGIVSPFSSQNDQENPLQLYKNGGKLDSSLADGVANVPFFHKSPVQVKQKSPPSSLEVSSQTSMFSLKTRTTKTLKTDQTHENVKKIQENDQNKNPRFQKRYSRDTNDSH